MQTRIPLIHLRRDPMQFWEYFRKIYRLEDYNYSTENEDRKLDKEKNIEEDIEHEGENIRSSDSIVDVDTKIESTGNLSSKEIALLGLLFFKAKDKI